MNDHLKTKTELIKELESLRKSIAEEAPRERKQNVAALKEIEERIAALAEASSEAIFFSEKSVCIYQNLTAEKMFGYSREEAVGKMGTDWIIPEHRNQVMENMLSGFEGPYEVDALRKDGSTFQAEIRAGISHYMGRSVRTTALRDITERKQAEDAHTAQKLRLESILEGTNVGTWEWNVQTGKAIFNGRWASIIGCTMDELAPVSIDTWTKLTHPDDLKQSGELLEQHFNGELDHYECEARMRHKNGSWVWVLDRGKVATWTEDHKPLLMAGTHMDISERKQAEEALAQSDSLRELLLDIITHDLRNPAGNIYALSEAARKGLPENKFLEAIYTSSGRLIEVLNQTTILSQAAFGEMIPKAAMSLNKLLQEAVDEFATALSTAEMELVVAIAPNVIVEANPLIAEVFKNYISNAIKYARDGKRVVIEAIIEEQAVVVRVKDFGKTLAEADREQVFQRRIQLENGKERGRGLGLAIVKRIATAHDGEVWVEPNTPVGNSFCLRIPS